MPRLPSSLIRRARQVHPSLPNLLKTCRDLGSAQNELRWLGEHVQKTAQHRGDDLSSVSLSGKLRDLCIERGRGKPLQYILGTEFFGDLELQCKPGVLIPRPETAQAVLHLAERLKRLAPLIQKPLRVLDLCTGTGCIPLLLAYELQSSMELDCLGVDVSPIAIELANENHNSTLPSAKTISFRKADVLGNTSEVPSLQSLLSSMGKETWDVITCNPPYISPNSFTRTTARSVRNFEPRLALVPSSDGPFHCCSKTDEQQGDLFYPEILRIAQQTKAKVVMMEVADSEQAARVYKISEAQSIWKRIEIWKDDPAAKTGVDRTVTLWREPFA